MTEDCSSDLAKVVDSVEPQYKSRGEAAVGRILDHYGIPFVYEQPTPVFDRGRQRVWRPDFTLPQHGGLLVEYAGMMDVPDYARGIVHKQRAYRANGIPAHFVYPEDLTDPGFQIDLLRKIELHAYEPVNRAAPYARSPYR